MFIPNFPQPYPDELLYSLVARFYWLFPSLNTKSHLSTFLGLSKYGVAAEFPTNLNKFRSKLNPNYPLAVDKLIQSLTMLPYYAPFITSDRLQSTKQAMLSGDYNGDHLLHRVGLAQSGLLKSQRLLRYCPVCFSEEKIRYGEAYWHRMPQVSGVMVCPLHRVFLEESDVPLTAGRGFQNFRAAEEIIPTFKARKIDLKDALHATFLRMAENAYFLSSYEATGQELVSLQTQYMAQCMKLGYVNTSGYIKWDNFLNDYNARFSVDYFRSVNCEILLENDSFYMNWANRMIHFNNCAHPPIRHLILMELLGMSAYECFQPNTRYTLFGSGPWECGNPLCPKHAQSIIHKYTLDFARSRIPITGIFACPECGQQYTRSITNGREERRLKVFGSLWQNVLKQLWGNPMKRIEDIGKDLGVDIKTVIKHAAMLNLAFPRQYPNEVETKKAPFAIVNKESRMAKMRTARRTEWLAMRATYPDSSCMELKSRSTCCYWFLVRHDREWYEQNKPANQCLSKTMRRENRKKI